MDQDKIRELVISIRQQIHSQNEAEVSKRWNFEEGVRIVESWVRTGALWHIGGGKEDGGILRVWLLKNERTNLNWIPPGVL